MIGRCRSEERRVLRGIRARLDPAGPTARNGRLREFIAGLKRGPRNVMIGLQSRATSPFF